MAQVACGYGFTYSSNINYNHLSEGNTSLILASGADQPTDPTDVSPTDEDIFPNQPLGFTFQFNGNSYTNIGVATNGWVWFGATGPVKAAGLVIPFTNVLASDAPIDGIISALNADLEGRWSAGLASIRTKADGITPNRTFTIEWKNFKALDDAEGTGYCGENRNRFDFQIILQENGNKISFAYNTANYCWQGYNQLFQIGLRGATRNDVHTRNIPAGANAWSTSMLGGGNATAIIKSSSPVTVPAENARFTFFPSTPLAISWVGTNENWNNPANWSSNLIPMRCNDVILPSGKSHYPELTGNQAVECKNLQIADGAALTLKESYASFFSCFGDLVNNGVISNNTNSYLTLSGGNNNQIGGTGHYIGTDLYITSNSSYTLTNDMVIRNLWINSGASLNLENKVLDVFSIQQQGTIDQGTGVLVIEGDASVVQLTDSTFIENNGTTFFGNGEVWSTEVNQLVPSITYNNLWVRTNKNYSVQLGSDQDFSCKNLLFYNPGEPGGIALTARNITVTGNFKLGIDSLPGTELEINHTITRLAGNGNFQMGAKDNLNITHAATNSQTALNGFGTPTFAGSVAYTSANQQTLVKGNYNNLQINGAGQRFIQGKVNLAGILKLNAGTLQTNDSLSLQSDSSKTALISGQGVGQINGNVEIERYVNGTGNQNILLSNAYQQLFLSDFADDFPILGPDGAPLNSNPNTSVFKYQESNNQNNFSDGWLGFTNTQSTLSQLRGYMAAVQGGSTISTKGIVNSGNQQTALSVTNASGANKGWNLVGNPYPSPIDWNKVAVNSSLNISRAVSKMGAGNKFNNQFATWLPLGTEEGLGINGATRYIGSQEGFFVRAFSADTLRLNNTHRADVLNTKSVMVPETVPFIRMSLLHGQQGDETLIYFSQQCSNSSAIDGKDAEKLKPTASNAYWFSLKDSVRLGIQGRNKLEQPDSIPLGISVPAAGSYLLRMSEAIHLPATAMIFLEDRLNNTLQNLRQQATYTATLTAGTTIGRFFLKVTPGVNVTAFQEGCLGGDGRLTLTNSTSTNWDVEVFNSNDSLVGTRNAFTGNWTISDLNADEYRLHFTLSGQNLEVQEWATVAASNGIIASFVADKTEGLGANQEVTFTSTTSNAEQLFWNFGNDMMASGEPQVTHVFETPGTYQVVLTANRSTCSDTATMLVHVVTVTGINEAPTKDLSTFAIFPNPASTQAFLKLNAEKELEDATLYVVDISGKIVQQTPYNRISPGTLLELNVNALSKGNYQVIVSNASFRAVSRLVVGGR